VLRGMSETWEGCHGASGLPREPNREQWSAPSKTTIKLAATWEVKNILADRIGFLMFTLHSISPNKAKQQR
jgi:hypothetical protein